MMVDYPHLMGRLFDKPLMIEPAKLRQVIDIIEPKLMGQPLAARPAEGGAEEKPYQVDSGVAVIPIQGSLVYKSMGIMEAYSGMTSYQKLGRLMDRALGDPDVRAIMLDVDSPGGEVDGCFELADKIYQARRTKPIWAYVDPMCCSAAYALASGAEKIYVSRTGVVGSIGVFMAHIDQSGADEQRGLKYSFIFAGEHKVDGNPHEPLSDGARSGYQSMVDDIYRMFTSTVARNRNMAVQAVRDTEAQVYMGTDGVKLGLADEVTTREQFLNAMRLRGMGTIKLAAPTTTTATSREERNMNEPEVIASAGPDASGQGKTMVNVTEIAATAGTILTQEDSPLVQELMAQIADMRQRELHKDAIAAATDVIEASISGDRMTPGERDLNTSLATALHEFCAQNPGATLNVDGVSMSFFAAFEASLTARPKNGWLTTQMPSNNSGQRTPATVQPANGTRPNGPIQATKLMNERYGSTPVIVTHLKKGAA